MIFHGRGGGGGGERWFGWPASPSLEELNFKKKLVNVKEEIKINTLRC